MAGSCAQVQSDRVATLKEVFEAQDVRIRKIVYMDVITNRGAVGSGVIGPEYFHFFAPTQSRLDQ